MDEPTDGIPPDLISDPAFVEACARRDVGTIFDLARRRAGLYPSRIARLTGLTMSRVGEILSGRRRPSSLEVLERVADGLRIPGSLLGLADRYWERPDTELRTAPVETWEVLETLGRSRVSAAALRQLEMAVLEDAELYPSTAPGALIPRMNEHLAAVRRILGEPQTLRSRRQCVELLAILSGLLGLAFLDAGDRSRSAAFIDVGHLAADEAEADGVTAWLLTMQGIILTTIGRPAEAAELLERAEVLVAKAPHRRRAWITAQLARAYAETAQSGRSFAALDRATQHLDHADAMGGLDFFTPARLHGVRGTCRYLLGDYEAAASSLESALAERREIDIKGRAMLTFDLAECRIQQGETEEGCRLGHVALDLVSAAAVEPGILRAQALIRCLGAAGPSSAMTALTERMRELRTYAAIERTG